MFPNNLDLKTVVLENQALKNEISELKSCSENVKMIANVAGIIRDEISKMNDTMPWPPSETDLTPDKVKIGENLDAFLNTLLTGRLSESNSLRANRLKQSYAQDIIYGVSNGRTKTPKSILLPSCIKSLTNCTELINIVCRYGHCISFTILEELETEYAINLIQDAQIDPNFVFIPEELVPDTPIITVWDNIDQLEETLMGVGTSHRCNGIGVQPKSALPVDVKMIEPKSKRCRRSLTISALDEVEQYYTVKRQSPGHLSFPEVETVQQC